MRARFDRFTVDLNSGELSRAEGSCPRIQQKPLQLLCLLLEAEGKVVTRDQLRGGLWPGETFVDFEHGINTAIKKLRQVLEDSVENPKFVETLPKVGYRFLAPVEWVTDSDGMYYPRAVPAISSDNAPLPQPRRSNRPIMTRNALLTGLTIGALAALLLYYSHRPRSNMPQPTVSLAVTNVGEKYSPSLSPNGQQLAFAWNGGVGP